MRNPRPKYPPYPGSNRDYAVQESAKQALRKPNKRICIYCHCQAASGPVPHLPNCPAKDDPE